MNNKINISEFLKKYPSLKIIHGHCDHCHLKLSTTIPFIEKGCIGLKAPVCSCNKGNHSPRTFILINKKDKDEWAELFQ